MSSSSSVRHSAGQVEVATFRREGEYLDGRRPESVEFCTPEEDAHRRDFTINGMFYDPLEQRVLDYVGGEADLHRKVIRCIGSPLDRFNEDKLRMLRAVRFTARFDFELERETAAAVRDHASGLLVVSIERITQELRQMLTHPSRRRAVELADDLGVWSVILPEIPLDEDRELTLGKCWPNFEIQPQTPHSPCSAGRCRLNPWTDSAESCDSPTSSAENSFGSSLISTIWTIPPDYRSRGLNGYWSNRTSSL